jgi:hypothetical protein
MAHCPLFERCAFLKDDTFRKMQGLIHRFQETYCHDNFSGCARYKIASVLGESFVPAPMMPTQIDWARQVLSDQVPSSPADKDGQ